MRTRISRLIIVGLFATAVALSAMAFARPAAREITLEARDMAYFLPGDSTPNPTLALERGETVRIRFVNRDVGMHHDLLSEGLGLASRAIPGDGSTLLLQIKAPEVSGMHDYLCSFHPLSMRGRIEIR